MSRQRRSDIIVSNARRNAALAVTTSINALVNPSVESDVEMETQQPLPRQQSSRDSADREHPIMSRVIPIPRDIPDFDIYGDIRRQLHVIESICLAEGMTSSDYIRALVKATRFDEATCEIARRALEQRTGWEDVKSQLINRFSGHGTQSSAIQRLWDLRQGQNERPDSYAERFTFMAKEAKRANDDLAIVQQFKTSLNEQTKLELRRHEMQMRLSNQPEINNLGAIVAFLQDLTAVRAMEQRMTQRQRSEPYPTPKFGRKHPYCRRCEVAHPMHQHVVNRTEPIVVDAQPKPAMNNFRPPMPSTSFAPPQQRFHPPGEERKIFKSSGSILPTDALFVANKATVPQHVGKWLDTRQPSKDLQLQQLT